MSQILQTMTRKDGKAKGQANRLHDGKKNNLTISDIFNYIVLNKPIKNKITDGKSKNQVRDVLTRQAKI